MLTLIRWICSLPLALTICIFGIFGNIISVYVWHQVLKKRILGNPSTALYLIALSVCGIGLLFFFIFTDSIPVKYPILLTKYSYAIFLIFFAFPMVKVSIFSCIWFTVAVAFNRMILTFYPTLGKKIYTVRNTCKSIGVILLACIALNIPVCFRLETTQVRNHTTAIYTTDFGATNFYAVYDQYFMCIIIVVIPWLSIAIFNIMIYIDMKKRRFQVGNRMGRDELRLSKQDGNITSMLLCSTIVFLLLIAWQCISQCMFDFHDKGIDENPIFKSNIATEFGKLGILIYASSSCLIYGLRGTVFRREISYAMIGTIPQSVRSKEQNENGVRQ